MENGNWRSQNIEQAGPKYCLPIVTEEKAEYRGTEADRARRQTWDQILNPSLTQMALRLLV